MLNASVWWMNIETKARFNSEVANKDFDVKTRLDPFVFMFGVGYRF